MGRVDLNASEQIVASLDADAIQRALPQLMSSETRGVKVAATKDA